MTPGTADDVGEPPADGAPEPEDTRGRIVAAAARCFYRDGIWATGVDALAAEAGLSKRTLYNHFPSKDAVIAAYLAQREEQWSDRLRTLWEAGDGDPVDQVIAYVRGYARPVEGEVFRGSAFINAAAELADTEHEALAVIRDSMDRMQQGVSRILQQAGMTDVARADDFGTRILYLIEGAVAVGGARRDDRCLDDVERYIRDVLERVLS